MNKVTINAIESIVNGLEGAIGISTLLDISTNGGVIPTPEVMHGSLTMIIATLRDMQTNLNLIINQMNS